LVPAAKRQGCSYATDERTNKQTDRQTDVQHYRVKPPLYGGAFTANTDTESVTVTDYSLAACAGERNIFGCLCL